MVECGGGVWKRGMEEQKKKAGRWENKRNGRQDPLPVVDGGPCYVLPSNFGCHDTSTL